MSNLTEFLFFKNTPLTDFQNTILFPSNKERDSFFLKGNHYETIDVTGISFNFIRDRQEINLPIYYNSMQGVNYCTFLSEFEPSTRYYAFVVEYEYVNDRVTRASLLIDPLMTFCQGKVLENLNNISVVRSHLTKGKYNSMLPYLKTNMDILKTYSKRYTNEEEVTFNDFDILIQSTCDLTSDFGDVDNPIIETSEGLTYDKMTSPVDLYVVKKSDFRSFMRELSPYPWISQNLTKIVMIPSELLHERYYHVEMESTNFKKLNKLNHNGGTLPFIEDALEPVNKTYDEMLKMFGLKNDERHLLRNEYTTTEVYTYDGQQLIIDNGLLNPSIGLEWYSVTISGFHNEIGLYPRGYKGLNTKRREGSFLNDAIFFRNFDDIPILVDSYNLTMANTANQRNLAESQLITNRAKSLTDENTSARDKFFNGASMVSNLSVGALLGKFNDEHNFYKQQQAEFADMALQSSTITSQTSNNSLAIANNYFGIHVKYSQPNLNEWNKVKKYYKMFGYEIGEEGTKINRYTQNYCDYVQAEGNFVIPNMDVGFLEMIQGQLQNGMRFWHNRNVANPMNVNIMDNTFR